MADPSGMAARASRMRIAAAVLCSAAVAALWLEWPAAKPHPAPTPLVVVASTATTPRSAVESADRASPAASPAALAWLSGTWSHQDNGGRRDVPCDLKSATTYLPEGQFIGSQENGRFATDGRSVTLWGRITYDIDAGEDRSRFEDRTTLPLIRLGDNVAQIGGERLFRCERRAPHSAS